MNSFSPNNDFCWTHVVRSSLDDLYLDVSSDCGGWTEHRHPPTKPCVSRNMATHAHSASGISDFDINIMELVCYTKTIVMKVCVHNRFDLQYKKKIGLIIVEKHVQYWIIRREIRLIPAFHFMIGKFKWLFCYWKQKAHGPYRAPEKQTHSINTFAQSKDYAITLREKIIISYLTSEWFIIYKTFT